MVRAAKKPAAKKPAKTAAIPFDRTAEDVGNIVSLEHVNVRVPDQAVATAFYIATLGLTRDPYMMTEIDNMWVNVGRSQFHLPTRGTDVLRGHNGLVIAHYDSLAARLKRGHPLLAGTRFAWKQRNDRIDATCPWGNRLRLYPPDGRFGPMTLGMPYVCFDVPKGAAEPIGRFYAEIIGAPATLDRFDDAPAAFVCAGPEQQLVFRETKGKLPPFDGHHIQVYIADFSGPHRRLAERGLITEESDAHQYRFQTIVDPASGVPVYELEHEVRSLRHPLRDRPLVNRNPAQRIMGYRPGHDAVMVG
jgi:catechol 2,3-dioxygenase-like lactoylglutathione lyase family enzyme